MDNTPLISPKWSSTTKLIVGLTVVAIISALLIRFRTIIGPLMLAFMLAYLFYPVAAWVSRKTKISWRTAVNILYLLVLILVLGLFTLTGLAVFQQLQSLLGFIQNNVTNLPTIIAGLTGQTYMIGPFEFSLAQYDLTSLSNQLLGMVQTALGRAGGLISSLATGAATSIGWALFVLLISYFLLADASRVSGELVSVDVPGYHSDVQRLGYELQKIWNAFLRGQLIIMLLIMLSYEVTMGVLGVRFALGIAILAGLGRFVPYIGPLILWIVTILVAYFQGGNYFGLTPLYYAGLVVLCGFILDQIFDNIITPRFLGETLGVHPAAVLVAAIIAANLIGLIGLILAAPVVATLKLLGSYTARKLFDQDPWPEPAVATAAMEMPWVKPWRQIREWAEKKLKKEREKEQ